MIGGETINEPLGGIPQQDKPNALARSSTKIHHPPGWLREYQLQKEESVRE